MEDYIYKRQNFNQREKLRKKRRRRKIFFSSVGVALVLGAGGFFLRNTLLPKLQEAGDSFVKAPLPEAGNPGEAPKSEELPEVKEFTPKRPAEKIPAEKTAPEVKDLKRLKEGSNHSYEASAYAYDTRDVKAWMRGRKDFEGEKNLAFLTFDDGPHKNTEKVLDVLKRHGVPGTFFLLGDNVDKNGTPLLLQRYIEEGHGIAVHSYSHDYSYLYPGRSARPDRILEEYEKTRTSIRGHLGESFDTHVFRFPGGSMSWKNMEEAQNALLAEGIVDIDWNSMSGDAEPKNRRPATSEAMGAYAMKTFRDNGDRKVAVILMHDVQKTTPEYLDHLIDEFLEAGFTFGILK
ncbi:polysaccharide deacetylase family protein [Proteiniclasticum ruminis]|uniref:Peptidoglycan/xylan/chitin deacetylase, PgdA/CDA1 family n=1 Tax=Proteiniclasticum ruminis TaxID=398199 RepID=A0A1I5AH51_9CLOT|nr:polysaccharide deacetylase family protein [Proteiniclasticum ruminis]SFN61804.1 Peptidoglycan/xylan/chitin deacetylase, PgdA/CDA1 family [Proteiniclasticum ruminis]